MFVMLIGLNGQDQGKGNGSSDRPCNRDHRKFLEGDCPLLGDEFEDERDEEDGSGPGYEADQYFEQKEGDGEYLIFEVEDH